MPNKIRELKVMLRDAGWILIAGGKGSHTKWQHPGVPRKLILSGHDGEDAKPKQQRDVDNAIREALEGR